MYIRPVLYGASAQLGLNPPEEYTFLVLVVPSGVYHGVHPISCLILEEFDRTAPFGTGTTKVGGNYAPVLRWSERAKNEGFGITLHLDSKTRTEIDEFSTAGFIGIKKNGDAYTLVVPKSNTILKSSTVESTCDLAKSFGWAVEQRRVKYEELEEFEEVLAAGTATALVPIKSILFRSQNKKYEFKGMDGEPGEAYVKLVTKLKGIQCGKLKDEFGWHHYVDDPTEWMKKQQNGTIKGVDDGVDGSVDKIV